MTPVCRRQTTARHRALLSQKVATAVVNLFIGIAIGTLLTVSVHDPPGYD